MVRVYAEDWLHLVLVKLRILLKTLKIDGHHYPDCPTVKMNEEKMGKSRLHFIGLLVLYLGSPLSDGKKVIENTFI